MTLQGFNTLAPGKCGSSFTSVLTWNEYYRSSSSALRPVEFSSAECHRPPLMITQHWFRLWLGAVRQQAIAWTNADLCKHWFKLWLGAIRQQAIAWTNADLCKHWFRLWFGIVRQEGITWSNVDPDLCHHMASQYVNSSSPSASYMHQWIGPALLQIMACHLVSAKPLSEPILEYYQLYPMEQTSEIVIKIPNFSFTKMHLKISSAKWRPFCPGGNELTVEWVHTWEYIALWLPV